MENDLNVFGQIIIRSIQIWQLLISFDYSIILFLFKTDDTSNRFYYLFIYLHLNMTG